MNRIHTTWRWWLIGTVAAAAVALATAPALASNTIGITQNGGARTASIADLTRTVVTYSHDSQTQTGTMVLTADDSTGEGAGWNVTVQSSAFFYTGAYGGTDIAASNFSITTARDPSRTAGQTIDATHGPEKGATGALEMARRVIYADAAYGMGTCTQNLESLLTIPRMARKGTYTGTMTVTIAAGPGT